MKVSRNRRGVLLLVVLGLLAMFGLIAVTFVLVTGQALRSAAAMQRIDQFAEPPRYLLDQAFRQVVRGSVNPMSVIGPHSLLEDLYGNSPYRGQIVAPSAICGGQIVEIQFPDPLEAQRRVGCVLTILSGNCAGESTLVVGYADSPTRLHLLATETFPYAPAGNLQLGDQYIINRPPFSGTGFGYDRDPARPDLGANIVGNWPVALCPNPANIEYQTRLALGPDLTPNTFDDGESLANEDYDAVDFQNMLLGAVIYDHSQPASRTGLGVFGTPIEVIPSLHRPALINYWQSTGWGNVDLRRRVLLRPLVEDNPAFKAVNPAFDPSNAAYNPVAGPWDVDNDGDGVPDSIWVDLGLPVRPAPDGRLYKPLFAILCLDMDGRLNLNAHGNWTQTVQRYYELPTNPNANVDTSLESPPAVLALLGGTPPYLAGGGAGGSPQLAMLPRGQGYGPAEINLLPLFGESADPYLTYQRLLGGIAAAGLDGRYGEVLQNVPLPGPGYTGFDDLLSQNMLLDYRSTNFPPAWNYWAFLTTPAGYLPDAYGSPINLNGAGAVALDMAGQPLYLSMDYRDYFTGGGSVTSADDPYELDLSRLRTRGLSHNANFPPTGGVDNPFAPAELERLLRPFDRDSSQLPRRLFDLTYDATSGVSPLHWFRHEITTESWDLPCPNAVMSRDVLLGGLDPAQDQQLITDLTNVLNSSGPPRHLIDVMALLMIRQRAPVVLGGAGNPATVDPRLLRELLPLEIRAGRRMDLNRPFGNGQDDNANLVVDEAEESQLGEMLAPYSSAAGAMAPVPVNHTNGQDVNMNGTLPPPLPGSDQGDWYLARQHYARHLYVLMMMLANKGSIKRNDPDIQTDEDVARLLAQWAVNVVDFRDRDSIMTCFEYDPDPFLNGAWRVDGDPATDEGIGTPHVVWGCERPELLMTETLAFHDRKTEDTATERHDTSDPTEAGRPDPTTEPGRTQQGGETDPVKMDGSYDQTFRPEGSLFVELYNPWTMIEPKSGELYGDHNGGVDLARVTPGVGLQNASPVWRVIIVAPNQPAAAPLMPYEQPDPDDPLPANQPEITRFIYFTDISQLTGGGLPPTQAGQLSHYPSTPHPQPVDGHIFPGRYAVIGPGKPGATGANRTITYVGFRTGQTSGTGNTRQIDLDPAPGQPHVVKNNDPFPVPGANQIHPPVCYVVDAANSANAAAEPRRLSVSEPIDGYPDVLPGGGGETYDPGSGKYSPAVDVPLDAPGGWRDSDLDDLVAKGFMGDKEDLMQDQRLEGFALAHLQRLANPLQPWDPVLNPYRTIDSMPIDLTVFNGAESQTDPGADVGAAEQKFASRQRGYTEKLAGVLLNLWKQESLAEAPPAASGTVQQHKFNKVLAHSLGYLNDKYGSQAAEIIFGPPQDQASGYQGYPQEPFPWLNWNNRPFISQLELLLVPTLRCSKLLARSEHEATNNPEGPHKYFRFITRAPTATYPVTPKFYDPHHGEERPFGHLLDFLHSERSERSTAGHAPQFFRLMEYVHVPSRFMGTTVQPNPTGSTAGDHWFHPPFQQVSTYREPGRINLNTIFSAEVFYGLINNFPHPGMAGAVPTFWPSFVQGRRGYGTAVGPLLQADPSVPTFFRGVFRSHAGGHLVPLDPLRPLVDVDATVLRRDDTTVPLNGGPSPDRPLFDFDSTVPYADADRNPYFRYAGIERLGNLVTTRSNVYAVWITVGYFEAIPTAVTPIHPDGYELATELGSEDGRTQRHRGFYLFDRSIPVGFERGQDLNMEKALLIKRFIE